MHRYASLALFSGLFCPALDDTCADQDHADREREAVQFLEEAEEYGSYSARALLGHVHSFGLAGEPQNVSRAVELYERALRLSREAGSVAVEAANGLGLVYSKGLGGVAIDAKRAMEYFKLAADAGHADGVYNMAVLLTDKYPSHAHEYFAAAAEVGHLGSLYELARLRERDYAPTASTQPTESPLAMCKDVVQLYKRVAERAVEVERLLDAALALFNAGSWDRARVLYEIAAETGSEVAQSNAVWLMERRQWRSLDDNEERQYIRLVTRAAEQNSPDALVRLGDWEFGRGNHAAAFANYQEADYLSHGTNGQALYSIGFMHEHGDGGATLSRERAGLYYLLAGKAEPAVWHAMALLRLKLAVKDAAERLISLMGSMQSAFATWSEDNMDYSPHREGEVDTESITGLAVPEAENPKGEPPTAVESQHHETHTSTQYEFTAALQFSGLESQLDVELAPSALGLEFQDFTIETWLFINGAEQAAMRTMTLVDALDNFQVEFVRAPDDPRTWRLQFRKFSLVHTDHPEMVVTFSRSSFTAARWYHIALIFDARTQSIALFVDGQQRQRFVLQSKRFSDLSDSLVQVDRRAGTRLVAIASSLSRHVGASSTGDGFWGQLARFRIWSVRMQPDEIARVMIAQQNNAATEGSSRSQRLVVDLRCQLRSQSAAVGASGDEKEQTPSAAVILNGNHVVPAAQGVELKFVPFPPNEA